MTVTLIAAVARNGVIGADGGIPWHLPEDFAHFKATTLGHTLVMGRATYESIGRPLPGRTTIVVTRDPEWTAEGVFVVHSLEEALAMGGDDEVFIAGGAAVYEQAMAYADVLLISEVDLEPEGDTFFPPIDIAVWADVAREVREGFTIVRWERLAG